MSTPCARYCRQGGVALLSVMLILVLLTTLVAYTTEDEDLAIRRLTNMREAEQSFQVAMGGEQWGVKVLEKDILDDKAKGDRAFDHHSETWGNLGGSVKVEGTESTMLVSIEDAQGKLNLNNLVQGKPPPPRRNDEGLLVDSEGKVLEDQTVPLSWYQLFQNLLFVVGSPPELADVVVDWLDANEQETGLSGAEDLYYLGLETPYRAANRQLTSLGELKFLSGFDQDQLARVLPHVTVLPLDNPGSTYTAINVNTASPILLAAISGEGPLDPDMFAPLLAQRKQEAFANLQDYLSSYDQLVSGGSPTGTEKLLAVSSNYFIARTCAETGRIRLSQQALLKKVPLDEVVRVVRRERFYGCPVLTTQEATDS